MQATSSDGTSIYYEVTGTGDTALVFAHGWLGNARWWDAQRDALAPAYKVVQLDLAGHGQSGRTRAQWSADAYADDIAEVARAVDAERIVLVGHSMSGAYATLACERTQRLAALVLVDTLKDLDALLPPAQVEAMLTAYRTNYRSAVETMLPKFLFAPGTPPEVVARLTREFLEVPGDVAATMLEPLYRFDVREAARHVRVPVRAIVSDLQPTNATANRAYFADYEVTVIPGYGHYPMLEAPEAFNAALRSTLATVLPGADV